MDPNAEGAADVTGDVTGGPTGEPTGDVAGEPTGGPTGDVAGEPTGGPTGDVAGEPTGDGAAQRSEPSSAPAPGRAAGPASGQAARWRWELLALTELWALCGMAIAQPILEVTGQSPEFFMFYGARAAEILLLLLVVIAAPPVVFWLAGAATRLAGARVRRAAHALTVGALCAALAVQVGKQLTSLPGKPLALLSLVAGLVAAAAYARWTVVARLLRLAAVGPVVFALLFVFASPSSVLLTGGSGGAAAAPAGPGSGGPGSGGPGSGGTGPGATGAAQHPPVVLVIFDEFPLVSLLDDEGGIDSRRFPNFARLAAGSTWYRNATTVSGFTKYAVPSMLTGRIPRRALAPHYVQHPHNLFTLLGDAYRIRAEGSVVSLCPPRYCPENERPAGGLGPMFGESAALMADIVWPGRARREPDAAFVEPTTRSGPAGETRFVRFERFLDGLRPAAEPTLHVLHLLNPHKPFRFLPSGRTYAQPGKLPYNGRWWPQLTRQRHLAQAGYTDRLLGRMLQTLRDNGLYDDSLLVVTADHGISFNTHTYPRNMDRDRTAAAELGWVPLFIKEPGQQAARQDHRNWLQVDLLPTVADHAGVPLPWPVDGVSALGQPRGSAEKPWSRRPQSHRYRLDTAPGAAAVNGGPDDVVRLPAPPLSHLIGTPVADLPVTAAAADGPRLTVGNLDEFRRTDRPPGTVPALVWGDAPDSVPAGRHVAIAVNGVVAAVVPVLERTPGVPRFAGFIEDESLWRPGANQLELFLVGPGGTAVQRVRS